MSTWLSVRRRWQNLSTRWFPYRGMVCPDDDLPARMRPRVVYMLGMPVWRVAFICPCGCNEPVELCLMKEVRPHWQAATDDAGRITLHPSVWKKGGCRSHYFLREGRIFWV